MKHTRTLGISALLVLTPSIPVLSQGEITLNSQGLQALASETLDKAIQFFRTLSIQGGYVHFYDLQTGERLRAYAVRQTALTRWIVEV